MSDWRNVALGAMGALTCAFGALLWSDMQQDVASNGADLDSLSRSVAGLLVVVEDNTKEIRSMWDRINNQAKD